VFRKNGRSQWAFQRKTETGYVSRFGHLVGLHAIPTPKRLEVLPYALGRGTYDRPVFGSPFDHGHSYFGGAGLDVKYGLTSNLTLDAAVNPDFGQVESDPAFVNLTTVEQFLQERRPFFVEGASIFDFGGTGPYIQFGNTPQYFLLTPHRPYPLARTGGAARRVHRSADAHHHPRRREADR